jgi:hypothetical protein
MNTYLITAYAKLFSIHRLVQANSVSEAAAQLDQTGIRLMWIELAVLED